ncbi:MAG: CBS domain-containing protein [Thermococcus sp.]|uniref:CBS domain-containing protein n=1 Tax=Thermococcus sp. TaxID=35749 RepID=UPI000F13FDDC|nr:CBS domain-containing protein [Thermococcus sp.]RLF76376.1 MAG: inosine-5-monophosphate dehydrogenase [Thermococci archaeon]MCD6140666.1 CBS domain-containing protein [Thermococcus sp.]RLF78472.1 MAG: inosine-5-monophosphate dehydrogenase [Thermococci archaeon]RLF83597.1 MAG: inosine-5-monophosphate dehydrogenase [Thermococci archaeon]RLF85088.1 MAG: inosine-5-monophosphate dehydrogenase [Thermococci archaeon]
MDENAPIKVYMTKKLIGVKPDDTIQEACRVMVEFDIGSLVVVDNGNVVGFFTKSDIIRRVIVPGLAYNTPVAEIMSKELITVNVNTPLKKVLEIMAAKRIKHMLIEEEGKVVGIFTLSDLLEASRRKLETAISVE